MVAMALHRVRLEVVRGLGEEQVDLRLAAGAAHSRFGVGDQVRMIDEGGLDERQQGELDRRGIAAGIGHEPCAADPLPVDFGQPVDRFGEKLGRRVGDLVPLLPDGAIPQAEIRRKVDDARTRIEKRAHLAHRYPVGRREEYAVAALEGRGRRIGEREVVMPAQRREVIRDLHARLGAGGDRDDFDLGVARQQSQELDARVSGPPTTPTLIITSFPAHCRRRRRLQNDKAAHTRRLCSCTATAFVALRLIASRIACGVAPCASRPSCARLRAHRE